MPAVLITEPIAAAAVEQLRNKGYGIQTEYGAEDSDTTAEDVAAIIVRSRSIDAAYMDQYPNLRIIAYHGVGIDGIDLEAAKARGICVTITPGQNAQAVAEHTVALMLALSKKLLPVAEGYRSKGFAAKYDFEYGEITGKTLGVIGLGNIGRCVARMAHCGFGMRVLAYTPSMQSADPWVELVQEPMAVFRQADYISLHCPLTPQTRHLVDREALQAMKPTTCLINCARGAIVDQQALIEALQQGKIAGAALDVTDPEPCEAGDPLLHMPQVIVTPHTAASSNEALLRVANMCIENVEDVLRGKEPRGRIV